MIRVFEHSTTTTEQALSVIDEYTYTGTEDFYHEIIGEKNLSINFIE